MAEYTADLIIRARRLGAPGVQWLRQVREAGAMHGSHLLNMVASDGPGWAKADLGAACRDWLGEMERAGVIRRGRYCPTPSQAGWAGFAGAQSDADFQLCAWSWHKGANL